MLFSSKEKRIKLGLDVKEYLGFIGKDIINIMDWDKKNRIV